MFVKRFVPTVSVVIPSYNHEKYIRQCVDSVLCQSWRDSEVIVVDDGSTDGTHDILCEFGKKITYIRQENRGTQAARNAGIRVSTGEFVALLDSDDAWLPEKLEQELRIFEIRPDAGLVYSLAYIIDSTGEIPSTRQVIGAGLVDTEPAFDQLLVENRVPALTAVVRKACLDEVGLFDETLFGAADWDLWLRIAARWPVVCLEYPLALYRIHESNTTNQFLRTGQYFAEQKRVIEKAFELHGDIVRDSNVWSRARARVHLVGVEAYLLSSDLSAASQELAQALSLDPNLVENDGALAPRLAEWIHRQCLQHKSGRQCRRFVDQLFAESVRALPVVAHKKKRVAANAIMATVFSRYAAGDLSTVRSLLPIGVQSDLRWMLNRGVWSIMVEAFVGRETAQRLRSSCRC